MFDNVAFEVVIGLVFIYLLYSLLITIVGEMVSTRLGIRARLLRIAIERMMNDGYYRKIERREIFGGVKTWWRRFFLYEPDEFKTSFAGKFYDYPAIRYLSRIENDQDKVWRIFASTKPSYLSADYFADSLMNFLRDKGAGATDMDRIGFCLKFNTYHIQPKTLKQFRNLFENAGNNRDAYKQNLIKWFNETMDRNTGWYKRKMRFILFWLGFIIAVSFNVDSIRIAKILANDKEARGQLVSMGVALAKDSAKYKDFVYNNGDSVHSKAVIDTGFSRITRDINAANLVLGLGYPFSSFKKNDTYTIDSLVSAEFSLNTLPKKRNKNFSSASNFITKFKPLLDTNAARLIRIKNNKLRLDSNFQNLQSLLSDTLLVNLQIKSAPQGDLREKILQDSIQLNNSINSLRKKIDTIRTNLVKDSILLILNKITLQPLSDKIFTLTENKLLSIDSITHDTDKHSFTVFGKRNYGFGEKLGVILGNLFSKHLFGFIITALALSLGAPFWFDLLNKLVSIRGVGVKPEEKKVSSSDTQLSENKSQPKDSANLFTNEDKIDTALRIYGDQIKSERGVLAVGQGYYKSEIKIDKCVQVNVENQEALIKIKEKYNDKLRISDEEFVLLRVIVTGLPKLNSGISAFFNNPERAIASINLIHGWGSYGCIVEHSFSPQKFILSCCHVMKGNNKWDKFENNEEIIDASKEPITNKYFSILDNKVDVAYAAISEKVAREYLSKFKNPSKDVAITEKDVLTTEVVINGAMAKDSKGLIVHDSWKQSFTYPLDNGQFFDNGFEELIMISKFDEKGNPQSITQEKDSGSLVMDMSGNACGIVIAGDLSHTYAIKMSNVLQRGLSLQLT